MSYRVRSLWQRFRALNAPLGTDALDLVAAGGTEFMHSLIKLGVVDEYRLWVLPAVTGKGAALFPELDEAVKLRLVKSTAFPSGILELRYAPADTSA
jgi:dihydrofolate reductase